METEDHWRILGWDLFDVFHEFNVLSSIWNCVLVLLAWNIDEAEVGVEDVFCNPEATISSEELSIKRISDSSSILDIAYHVLHGFPREWLIQITTLSHMLLKEGH